VIQIFGRWVNQKAVYKLVGLVFLKWKGKKFHSLAESDIHFPMKIYPKSMISLSIPK